MNEKKLTDEEIVKALKCCMRIDGCDKCPLVEIPTIEQCRNNKNKCALDLIKHLQGENKRLKQSNKNTLFVNEQVMSENAKQKAEIERLTEENAYLDGCAKQFLADYQKCEVELSEQEDKCLDCPYQLKFNEIEKQAVKDTAKEICILIDNIKNIFPNSISGYEKALGWSMCIDKLKEICKERYGVSYEEDN